MGCWRPNSYQGNACGNQQAPSAAQAWLLRHHHPQAAAHHSGSAAMVYNHLKSAYCLVLDALCATRHCKELPFWLPQSTQVFYSTGASKQFDESSPGLIGLFEADKSRGMHSLACTLVKLQFGGYICRHPCGIANMALLMRACLMRRLHGVCCGAHSPIVAIMMVVAITMAISRTSPHHAATCVAQYLCGVIWAGKLTSMALPLLGSGLYWQQTVNLNDDH